MSVRNKKAKGSRNEIFVQKRLEDSGYAVSKSGGSLGLFDLMAVASTPRNIKLNGDYFICSEVLLVQVKANNLPRNEEIKRIAMFSNLPRNAQKIIAVVYDGQRPSQEHPKGISKYIKFMQLP